MDYKKYRELYDRHTAVIDGYDKLIVKNKADLQENSRELESAEIRRAAIGVTADPRSEDTEPLKAAATARVDSLREEGNELETKGITFEMARSDAHNSREALAFENEELEEQRIIDSTPLPEGERGVGNIGKGAAVLLTMNVAMAETAELRTENLETYQATLVQQYEAKSPDVPSPQDSQSTSSPHQPGQDQHHESGDTRPHLGPHTHEEHEWEDHRAQTTTLVISDPPADSDNPDGRDGPHQPPTQAVEAARAPQDDLAPPKDTEPLTMSDDQPSSGGQSAPPLAPPKDTEPLLITSDRENQLLLTDQRGSIPGPSDDLPPGGGGGGGASAAPPIPEPSDDVPAPPPAQETPQPDNDIQM